ncbi:MAG: hypothetical protein ACR2H3_16330 [Acidimicrobiales bacterium]
MDDSLGKVTVELHEDGYVSVRMDPKVSDPKHLRRAAEVLNGIASEAEAEARPVTCPVCKMRIRSMSAKPNGDMVLAPCGHTV